MDVTTPEQVGIFSMFSQWIPWLTTSPQARIAEEAGACAVMALERVPADIRREGLFHHKRLI